ncbi:MAG: threonine-phosphate decarboxylase [Proteobacteria bacterium]|nr:MAG: threonine-phosphate decarboxylase [Pseudomonadota bacterium]
MTKLTEEIFHGGNLRDAEKAFGIKPDDWLDLSTGINPNPWPVPQVPIQVWSRLPNESDGLCQAAKNYYGCNSLLPIPGSQFAIQTLPMLFPATSKVAIPAIGYEEHRAAWHRAGHTIFAYADHELDKLDEKIRAHDLDFVVVINPNNPSCDVISRQKLKSWLLCLKDNGGYLIIDEAFIDGTPELSMTDALSCENLIILRSLGKFFGLAGMRLGFVLAGADIRNQLGRYLGPWAVNTPARWIGERALSDKSWQHETRIGLPIESQRLFDYLRARFSIEPITIKSTPLFVSVKLDKSIANELYVSLARRGVLVRHIAANGQDYIRVGLLKNRQQWARFDFAVRTAIEKLHL